MDFTNFHQLPVAMPPMLPEVVGVQGSSRLFSLSYKGSKPFWSDGRAGATFSYYAAYQPLVEHLALALHLFAFHLGSDDEPPTHALLIDRQEAHLYVGVYHQVMQMLAAQHPPKRSSTPEELAAIEQHLAAIESLSFEQLREHGMFEFLMGATEGQKNKCWAMVAWLDELITEDLIQAYLDAGEVGNHQALHHLMHFQQRIDATRQRQGG
jgi:hypothetical protein